MTVSSREWPTIDCELLLMFRIEKYQQKSHTDTTRIRGSCFMCSSVVRILYMTVFMDGCQEENRKELKD
jgi:hypothetical protein